MARRRERACDGYEPEQAAATGWASRATDDDLADRVLDAVAVLAKLDAELAGAESAQVARLAPMLDRLRATVARLPAGVPSRRAGFRP